MACGGCGHNKTRIELTDNKYKVPVVNRNGSIVFPEGMEIPEIEGYELDSDNDRKLVPIIDVPCMWKITGIMLTKAGTYTLHTACNHNKCEHRGKPVNLDICKACPLREP